LGFSVYLNSFMAKPFPIQQTAIVRYTESLYQECENIEFDTIVDLASKSLDENIQANDLYDKCISSGKSNNVCNWARGINQSIIHRRSLQSLDTIAKNRNLCNQKVSKWDALRADEIGNNTL